MDIETITPGLARQWLEANSRNRPLKPGVVERYAEAMKAGQWEINGETIKFSASGVLLDGQHRLEAVARSGVTVRSYVLRGLPDKVFDTIDTGRNRNMRDILSLEGEENGAVLSTVLRYLYIHDEMGDISHYGSRINSLITTRDLLVTLNRHPSIRDSVCYVSSHRGLRPFLAPAQAAFCHYLFHRIDAESSDIFFAKLIKGADLSETDAVLMLRNRLVNVKGSSREGRIEAMALTIKAWNLYRARKPVRSLRWSYRIEQFPVAA